MGAHSIRPHLEQGSLVYAPGVFDMMSLLVADQKNFPAFYFSGFWNAASSLGLPDVGLATYRDFLSQLEKMTAVSTKPIIADADTGFGGLINLDHTVRGYERAGIAAIQIEDQVSPKRCGHQPGKQVVSQSEMVTKVKVACAARRSDDFLIIARTDARDIEGLELAIQRAKAYAAAGADVTFVEGPRSIAEMKQICETLDAPQMVNMAHGSNTPLLTAEALAEIGYAIAIIPSAPPLAAVQAMHQAYTALEAGTTACETAVSLYDFQQFCDDIGFAEVKAFEKKWARE